MNAGLEFSVDDRRALWALTTRHLRSRTYAAVLAIRSALRARANQVTVTTRGDHVVIVDDGSARDDEVSAIVAVVHAPDVVALHRLETRFGTDLLVALTTAASARIVSGGRQVDFVGGAVVNDQAVAGDGKTIVDITRPAAWRKEERLEMQAWLPAPRAVVVVDGKRWRRELRLHDGLFFARSFKSPGGSGIIGFSLSDATSKTTVMTRGLWVAQDTGRPRGLPVSAVWDDDEVSGSDAVRARARIAVERASVALLRRLAEEMATLGLRRRRQVRSLLLRAPVLPDAFDDVPLFDTEAGVFQSSLNDLRDRPLIVLGRSNADVLVDADVRAFLHRTLPTQVKDALPPPRRRLRFLLRGILSRRT